MKGDAKKRETSIESEREMQGNERERGGMGQRSE